MKKIIILAGNGELPYNVVRELEKRKLDFFIITFKNNKVSANLKKYNPIEILGCIPQIANDHDKYRDMKKLVPIDQY